MYRPPTDPPAGRTAVGRRGLVGTSLLAATIPLVLHATARPPAAMVALALLAFAAATRRFTPVARSSLTPSWRRPAGRRPELVVTTARRRR